MPLTVPSMTRTSNHHSARGDPAAEADEEQVVEIVEPPLVERARCTAARSRLRQRARPASASRWRTRRSRTEPDAAGPTPSAATATLTRISSCRRCRRTGTSVARCMPRIASGAGEDRLQPAGGSGRRRTAGRERCRGRSTGSASRISGTVIVRGDSWIVGLDLRIDVALAVERLAHQPEHVEGGHHGDDDADHPDRPGSRS